MTKRDQTRQETRIKLLAAAKEEFIRGGLIGLSTVDVAHRAGVAHGTLFFHFQTKEALLVEMLDQGLLEVTGELYTLLEASQGFEDVLNTYLDFLEREESFFAILARETPLYAPELRRILMGREAAIRYYFYRAFEKEVAAGRFKRVDITTTLGFLFATITYFLSMGEAYAGQGGIVRNKRRAIVETFLAFVLEK